ncbi:hypothetical protein NLJ89_g9314 [Agrocybe chaxingu]|uniref:F-box domain-containing protein n=1 Tax=Agrocybe chaxingu TaxID=84603 RepID=A0A9W8K073_9AGAR|nr:hypothetical protein NLJ89_g9314 [Agrocybe chaxingu]
MSSQRRICCLFARKKAGTRTANALEAARACYCRSVERLGQDLLWYIFSFNAEMCDLQQEDINDMPEFEDYPLTILRRTSQVCQSWQLALNSPSLWASVIDFAQLKRTESQWGKEILLRTGKSLLCIKGEVDQSDDEDFLEWCNSLLRHEWERLRRVDIRTYGDEDFTYGMWHDLLVRSTKHLESFVVDISLQSTGISTMATELFSGDAPSLRRLATHDTLFDDKAPLLAQLSTLWLSYREGPAEVDVPQILDILKSMPCLNALALLAFPETLQPAVQKIDPVNLPQLRELSLDGPLSPTLLLLDTIKPQPGCKLYFWSMNTSIAPQQRDSFIRLVGQYSLSYFEKHPTATVYFDVDGNNFLCGTDLSCEPCYPKFYIHLLSGINVNNVIKRHIPFLLPTLQFGNSLSTMTTLDLSFGHVVYKTYGNELLNLLASFPALRTVKALAATFYETISPLRLLAGATHPVFSSLRNVVLCGTFSPLKPFRISELACFYCTFFDWRCEAGHPVALLDIRGCDDLCDDLMGLRELERFKGLKVMWSTSGKEQTYICGSGTPEVLDFCSTRKRRLR